MSFVFSGDVKKQASDYLEKVRDRASAMRRQDPTLDARLRRQHPRYIRSQLMAYGASVAKSVLDRGLTDSTLDGYRGIALLLRETIAATPLIALMQMHCHFAARWGACGFPSVIVGHKLAASLMATSIAKDELSSVVFPWPAFEIQVPRGLLATKGREEFTDYDVVSVYVQQHALPPDKIVYDILVDADGVDLRRVDVPLSRIAEEPTGEDDSDRGLGEEDLDDSDDRAFICLGRLILGVCLEMSDPSRNKAQSIAGRLLSEGRQRIGLPTLATFILTRDVKIDVREAVRHYAAEGGKIASVQSLVRGHWKRQPHGPGAASRKWIQVEPYWRGPEDAPIVVRSHVIFKE